MGKHIEVKADLSGTVWKVLAEPGKPVAQDDVLAILESMKMEIPVEAPRAGTVLRVECAEGSEIAEGEVLFVIDADGH